MLNNRRRRCNNRIFTIINIINIFVFILGIFSIITLENTKFKKICQDGLQLTYLSIISNLLIPILITFCMIYIYYFTNNNNIINYLNILIQILEIFLGIIILLVYIINNDCIDMNDNKYLTNTEIWWYNLYNNTFIFTLVMIYVYILFFYCYYCLV
jgi:hypothetical protein